MSTTREMTVPDMGDFKDIPVIEVLVKPGDRVEANATLIVLESEKATLDVPSAFSGIVRELRITIGDKVSVGSTIGFIDTSSPGANAPMTEAPVLTTPVLEPSLATAMPMPLGLASSIAEPTNAESTDSPPPRPPRASPSLRRLAREFGVDLTSVTGSGPAGRILRSDIQQHVKSALSAAPPATGINGAAGLRSAPLRDIDFGKFGPVERQPLTRIRKLSGENLMRSWLTIPQVTNFEEADITDLEAFRKRLNAEAPNGTARITLLPFIAKAAVVVLRQFVQFNASLVGEALVLKHYFHIGIAADTPDGLLVPVIRDVHTKGVMQIAAEATALAAQARAGKLKLSDLQGGTFTISSLGGIGGTGFTPIINAPEVSILGVNRSKMRPVWNGSEFQPRLMLPLSLAWDHRVVDGAAAARFLANLANLLADFRRVTL